MTMDKLMQRIDFAANWRKEYEHCIDEWNAGRNEYINQFENESCQ